MVLRFHEILIFDKLTVPPGYIYLFGENKERNSSDSLNICAALKFRRILNFFLKYVISTNVKKLVIKLPNLGPFDVLKRLINEVLTIVSRIRKKKY